MKSLKKNENLCTSCHECEKACSKTWFKEENCEKSCIRIKQEGSSSNITVCTQCGECIDICQAQALYRDKNGIVRVNKDLCVGCFMCVGFCPEGAIFAHEQHTEPFKCIACGQCVKVCPTKAIYISEE